MESNKIKSSSLEKHSHSSSELKSLVSLPPTLSLHPKRNFISLGVCAMKKKVESKPMRQILSRLACPQLQIILMWQCLDKPWDTWPLVDALICFYSDGFPYIKAWNYVQKNKPFLINNLQKQQLLWDRTVIYEILQKIKVPVAKHYFVYRDEEHLKRIQSKSFGIYQQQKQEEQEKSETPTLLRNYYEKYSSKRQYYSVQQHQEDDFIILTRGNHHEKIKKPFVEKPFNSENHQICIYYPAEMGGGRKKLFRKIKNVSSAYQSKQNTIRRDGNYIYEEYLPTNGFDIKVYTIGPYYMYAQARKSPTLDGVVIRNKEGKQHRFPVILTPQQKYICNRIVEEFNQDICGFDLLRANGKSYVCDVNGWSFVKGNPKYWDDCSKILRKKILNHFFPFRSEEVLMLNRLPPAENEFRPPLNSPLPKVEELRSIVSIFRHADRSPKMKIKIKTKDKRFISFFEGTNKQQLKFKDAKNLTHFLSLIVEKISEMDPSDSVIKDFMQMKFVLESGGQFQGLTRKLQLKVVERQKSEIQGKKGTILKIIIILKWGGDLTHLGYDDAVELGKKMRQQRYDDNDCLSLYSSYRHDLKTYSSDQGRCIKTAAAFLKGFLSMEGELAPIISSMVQADGKAQSILRNIKGLLDCTSEQNHSKLGDRVCSRLNQIMNRNKNILQSYLEFTTKQNLSQKMLQTLKDIGHPRQKMTKLYEYIQNLVKQLQKIYIQGQQQQISQQKKVQRYPDQCQSIMLINSRWSKLKKDFYDQSTQMFNISKIPEIYDTVRHDYHRNSSVFAPIDKQLKENMYKLSRLLAHFVVCNQYGITDEERLGVATDICLPLMQKILIDLMFWKKKNQEDGYWKYKNSTQGDNWRHIRTRLYFTSASHMYSLVNFFTLGNNRILLKKSPIQDAKNVSNIMYMSYLSHIELRLYENLTSQSQDPNRFRLEVSFSTRFHKTEELKQCSLGGKGFTINEIQQFIGLFLAQKKKKSESQQKQNSHKQKKQI